MNDDREAALEHFLNTWGSGSWLAGDIGTSLTCIEVEALADLYRVNDREEEAKGWIRSHAEGDDCGDMHCTCDDPECIEERSKRE